jgi:hypothetical protein
MENLRREVARRPYPQKVGNIAAASSRGVDKKQLPSFALAFGSPWFRLDVEQSWGLEEFGYRFGEVRRLV